MQEFFASAMVSDRDQFMLNILQIQEADRFSETTRLQNWYYGTPWNEIVNCVRTFGTGHH
jgi:hypothetical protein